MQNVFFCNLDPVLENCLRPPPIPSLHLYIASCSPQQARQIKKPIPPKDPSLIPGIPVLSPGDFHLTIVAGGGAV